MTNNEKFFFEHWNNFLLGRISAPTQYVLEAYRLLYGKQYNDVGCGSCLSAEAQVMKNRYFELKKEIESTSVEMEEFVQKQSDMESVVNQQVVEKVKNKGGRPKK